MLRRQGCDQITLIVPSASRATNPRVYRAQHGGICKIQGVSVWICFWSAPTANTNFPSVLNPAGVMQEECSEHPRALEMCWSSPPCTAAALETAQVLLATLGVQIQGSGPSHPCLHSATAVVLVVCNL